MNSTPEVSLDLKRAKTDPQVMKVRNHKNKFSTANHSKSPNKQ